MYQRDDGHDVEEDLGFDPPSRGISYLMIAVGIVFLLPFILVSAASGGGVGAILSALLTVGWTFGLGMVFLIYGWRRLRTTLPDDEKE